MEDNAHSGWKSSPTFDWRLPLDARSSVGSLLSLHRPLLELRHSSLGLRRPGSVARSSARALLGLHRPRLDLRDRRSGSRAPARSPRGPAPLPPGVPPFWIGTGPGWGDRRKDGEGGEWVPRVMKGKKLDTDIWVPPVIMKSGLKSPKSLDQPLLKKVETLSRGYCWRWCKMIIWTQILPLSVAHRQRPTSIRVEAIAQTLPNSKLKYPLFSFQAVRLLLCNAPIMRFSG
ncbi:hypothetical protein GQ55_9G644300 [Panicum hallii var. hallii]|uniref:Uncharacterized protein n=1 Tax=Panicum hallii var. hallii TaxID=1504633 RepID=A0A2T7CIZ9_9POAL|nr:hypothetical protein GQ55_9G644300 [Panicum hallii var. hallii]